MSPDESIQSKLAEVCRQAKRLLLVQGLATFAVIALGAAFALGLFDYWLRSDEVGVRVLACTCWVLITVAAAARFLFRPWRSEVTALTAATWLERQHPELKCLPSAVAFIEQADLSEDSTTGSEHLRQEVVRDASARLSQIDLKSCLQQRTTHNVVTRSTLTALLIATICAMDLTGTRLAAQRLAAPLADHPWPRWNELEFVDPPQLVARGSDVTLKVVDRNARLFPYTCTIELKPSGEPVAAVKRIPMRLTEGSYTFTIPKVTTSFSYRAVGGDDETAWHHATVIEPPEVTGLSIRITPPKYARLTPRSTGTKVIRVLSGTRLDLTGDVNRPVKSIHLSIEGDTSAGSVPLILKPAGTSFSTRPLSWTVTSSTRFSFILVDPRGVQAKTDHWQVRVFEDARPTVAIGNEDDEFVVTSQVRLPVRLLVKDDLGIAGLKCVYQASGRPQVVQTISSPDPVSNKTWEFTWTLVLQDWDKRISPGDVGQISVVATDHKQQIGKSVPLRLKVVSLSVFRDLMSQRRAAIVAKLRRAHQQQQTALQTLKQLQSARPGPNVIAEEVDRLRQVQVTQRQIRSALIRSGSARFLTQQLDRDLAINGIQTPSQAHQLRALQRQLTGIGETDSAAVLLHLSQAVKALQGQLDRKLTSQAARQLSASLAATTSQQERIERSLRRLLTRFVRWETYQRFAREFHRIREKQRVISQDTEKIQNETIGRQRTELTDDLRRRLQQIADRQNQLGVIFGSLVDQMRQTAAAPGVEQATTRSALRLINESRVGHWMTSAAQAIRVNRVGNGRSAQQRIDRWLLRILNVLTDKDQQNLKRRLPTWEQQAAEMKALLGRHDEILKNLHEASRLSGQVQETKLRQVTDQQAQLVTSLDELGAQLTALGADRVADKIAAAKKFAGRSQAAAKQGRIKLSRALLDRSREMVGEAARAITDQIGGVQRDLERVARQQFEKNVRGILVEQRRVEAATAAISQQAKRPLSIKNRKKILAVAAIQNRLAAVTVRVRSQVPLKSVFALYLGKAADQMRAVGKQMNSFEVGPQTRKAQQKIVEFLRLIVDSASLDATKSGSQASNKVRPPTQRRSREFHVNGQLKLLSLIQQRIVLRTEKLEVIRKRTGNSRSLRQEAKQLAEDQLELLQMTKELRQRLRQ